MLRISILFAPALVSAFSLATVSQAKQIGDPVPDTFICQFVPGPVTATFEAEKAASASGGHLLHTYSGPLSGFAIQVPAHAVARIMAGNPLISGCQQSHYVGVPPGEAGATARPGGGGGGGGRQTTPWDITRVGGPKTPRAGAKAWVLDTGIDPNTGDLNIDTADSRVYLTSDTFGKPIDTWYDYNGHGTHVAGTIAAINNSTGIVGVAAGATVVSVKVLDSAGVAPDTEVLAGLQYIKGVARPGDVVNISIEADKGSTVLDLAVQSFAGTGIFVVMAAGNDSTDVDASHISPADNDGPYLYTVSAVDQTNTLASFSNYGLSVDYAEPGVNIVSLAPGGGTATKSGTSMAAPHLSGILMVTGGPIGDGGPITGDKDSQTDHVGVVP
jgi:subtilisin family serine protease